MSIDKYEELSSNYASEITPLTREESGTVVYQSINAKSGALNCKKISKIIGRFFAAMKFKYAQNFSLFEHILYFCTLSLGSYAGVLIRIYLIKFSRDNIHIFPSFYAQFVGSAVMGFAASHQKLLENVHKSLYQGITTGLCGSITTFSTLNSEASKLLFMRDKTPIGMVFEWSTVLIIGLIVSIGSLYFGKHLALISPLCDHRFKKKEFFRQRKPCRIIVPAFIIVFWACSTALIIGLMQHFGLNELLFSIVFCFVGTYIRWHLAPLNLIFNNFKLGTFIANISGVFILGTLSVVSSHFKSELSDIEHSIIKGLTNGFCGCLTTVSTFVMELSILSLKDSYLYGAASIILAQFILALIRGVYVWSI